MLVVGKLGARDDLPLLERYAKDETHCATFLHDPPPKPGQPVLHLIRRPIEGQDTTSQLRDVSAAMRLHLSDQKPQEFGFYWKWPFGDEAGKQNSLGTFNLYAIGFLRDADRTAAHKKAWNGSRSRRRKSPIQTRKRPSSSSDSGLPSFPIAKRCRSAWPRWAQRPYPLS